MSTNLQPPDGVPPDAWLKLARPLGDRWAITERDATGEKVGTAHRFPDGRKGTEKGGKRGLIYVSPLPAYAGSSAASPIYVAEGASDTAALLGLRIDAVGVPMAGQCADWLAELLADRHVVIVRDADAAGRSGTAKLVAALLPHCASVRVIEPPNGAKDVRAAVIAGADAATFESRAHAAPLAEIEPEDPADGAPILVRMRDVQPESVSWLWPGRIALGKLTLIAGDPGLGKSFLTLGVAACVSRGFAWPDNPGVPTTPGGVVILSAEDGIADTIRPRLDAAGGDEDRITFLQAVQSVHKGRKSARLFDLTRDLPALEQAIRETPDCRLVVIDPITAYSGSADSHNNAEIRALLAPLAAVAEKYGIAVVAVTHLNKNAAGAAIYRAMGSLAYAAAARSVWAVTKDKQDPLRRLFVPVKCNLAPDTGGLAYSIKPVGVNGAPVVAWEPDAVNVSADEALGAGREGNGEPSEVDACAEWMTEYLGERPRPSVAVFRDGKDAGFTAATIRRAQAKLRIKPRKSSFGGPWDWVLPAKPDDAQHEDPHPEDAHAPWNEHLRINPNENGHAEPKMLNGGSLSALECPEPSLPQNGDGDGCAR